MWLELRDIVVGWSANAWVFVSATDPEHYTEFIEWQSFGIDAIIERSNVAAAWLALNTKFPFEDSDTWKSAIF
jgi:hypothetical protein